MVTKNDDRKAAQDAANLIAHDLADRRGMPGDLQFGSDWAGARQQVYEHTLAAISDTRAAVLREVAKELRWEACGPNTKSDTRRLLFDLSDRFAAGRIR
jgi:hypothetical protein